MRAIYLGLLGAAFAWGQLESNTISVTASRSYNLQPDEVVFRLVVQSDTAPALDGLRGLQFESGAPGLPWVYTVAVPLTDTANTIRQLNALSKTLNLNYSAQETRASPQALAARNCLDSDLIADARVQAQKMAAAAQLTLGPIGALSKAPSLPAFVNTPAYAARSGDFAVGSIATGGFAGFLLGGFIAAQPSLAPAVVSCSLTVKFALVRY